MARHQGVCRRDKERPTAAHEVALLPCPDYREPSLTTTIDRIGTRLCRGQSLRGCRVLLKPNLVSRRGAPLSCTEGAFLLAVARWCIDQGARVRVGDSPAFGSAARILGVLGCREALARLGVEIAVFRESRWLTLENGTRVPLAVDALDCDLLVSVPRIKAHAQMGLTMAMKNYFGCVTGLHKSLLHMVQGGKHGCFVDVLLQIPDRLPPSFTLIDGICAMHRTGPVSGTPFPLGLVGGSWNPVALDGVLCRMLRVSPHQVPLLAAARARKMAGSGDREICYPLASPAAFQVAGFQVPSTLHPVRFSLFRFCRGTVHRFVSHCK